MNMKRFDRLTAALARTRRVMNHLGHGAPSRMTARAGARIVLVLCAPARFSAIAFALGPDVEPIGAMTTNAAIDFLGSRDFDACVVDQATLQDATLRFIEDTRRIGIHHALPIIVLGMTPNEPFLLEAGANAVVGPEALGLRVLPLAAAARTARLAREEMRRLRDEVVDQTPSGLSGPRVFEAHVQDVLLNAEDETAAIVALDIDGPLAAVVSAAGLVRVLTRAEDICTSILPNRIAVIAAGAEGNGVQRLADRLVAIIESSMMLDPETGAAVRPRASAIALPLAGFISVDEVLDTLQKRMRTAA